MHKTVLNYPVMMLIIDCSRIHRMLMHIRPTQPHAQSRKKACAYEFTHIYVTEMDSSKRIHHTHDIQHRQKIYKFWRYE